MADFTFEVMRDAWAKFRSTREGDLKKLAPSFTSPDEIYIKKVDENEDYLVVEFLGLDKSVDNTANVQQIKRIIVNWVKKFSVYVRIDRSQPDSLILNISKELKFSESDRLGEAAIGVFRRDPKTNKSKKTYKCIGGKKNGRKVANPDDCIGIPDWNKKIKFGISRRAKYGQSSATKTNTRLTNITARRTKKANARLKKARGF